MNKCSLSLLLCSCALLLSACSGTNRAYIDSIKYLLQDKTLEFSKEEVAQYPHDLLYVNIDNEITAALGLSFIDGDKYRWVSGDEVVFTMHHGVIVQTEGLPVDLHYTSDLDNNPLAGDDVLAYRWDRFVDLDQVAYGAQVSSTWRVEGESTQIYFDEPLNTLKIVELVTFSDISPFYNIGLSWENYYYLDANTKYLLSSTQKFRPDGRSYEMIYLSRAQRALAEKD